MLLHNHSPEKKNDGRNSRNSVLYLCTDIWSNSSYDFILTLASYFETALQSSRICAYAVVNCFSMVICLDQLLAAVMLVSITHKCVITGRWMVLLLSFSLVQFALLEDALYKVIFREVWRHISQAFRILSAPLILRGRGAVHAVAGTWPAPWTEPPQ